MQDANAKQGKPPCPSPRLVAVVVLTCGECGEALTLTRSGGVCSQGHGGLFPLTPAERIKQRTFYKLAATYRGMEVVD